MKRRLLIVDDHPVMRMGLTSLINSKDHLEICAETGSAKAVLGLVEEHDPDLVLLDLTLPDGHGLEVLKDLSAMHPDVPVLILSSNDESVYAERALKAGARGYIMKEAAAAHLIDAVGSVLSGRLYVSPQMSQLIVASFSGRSQSPSGSSPTSNLTDRELEVFQLIGEGKTSREISTHLGISVRTVDAHRAHIKEKLDLPNASVLVRKAVRWVETKQWD